MLQILQRDCNGKRPWKSILYYSVEGQVKWEFQKLQVKSAATDCNRKGLPLEAATGRWNGRQGGLDRESDWKLEWESVNGRVKGKLQKTGDDERLQLGEDFVSGGASSTTGKKRS